MDVGKIAVTALPKVTSPAKEAIPGSHVDAGFLSFGSSKTAEQSGDKQKEFSDTLAQLRAQIQGQQRNLTFNVDDSTGDVVVQVLDGDSGKVIRQIPSEEILRLSERLDEMRSLLFEAKA
ncbi:flagellar protein FlaG [Pseudomonas stutzeri]|uniref:flagellar protein FlaG n=1 Tax=Stutzerimonas stutzeri TaxID=316 RepID=UPI0021095248|nr:flagellar protein FlaG [Stutzerimonas stutzeri]MCQ4287222.1 flagellar protein FlaG [Stutzerimonas stutzeri]